MKSVKFSQAVEGYKLYFEAQHRSPHTLSDYMNTYKRFKEFLGNDPDISTITHQQIQKFLASRSGVSEKTVLNYHCGLSVLWTWAISEGLVKVHIIHKVERPTYCKKVIVPFSEEEIRGMLAVISRSKSYVRPGKVACQNTLPSADRNRAIILLLLHTPVKSHT